MIWQALVVGIGGLAMLTLALAMQPSERSAPNQLIWIAALRMVLFALGFALAFVGGNLWVA